MKAHPVGRMPCSYQDSALGAGFPRSTREMPDWNNPPPMDPSKKRKIRLVVALGLAVLLGAALIWTSFSSASEARTPSEVLAAPTPGKSFDMTGTVVDGSIERSGEVVEFEVRDRDGTAAVPVSYDGLVPDPFREGREVIVGGTVVNGTFVATDLITKCPSKFTAEEPA